MSRYRGKYLKVTDMCIWIDNNAYREDLTEEDDQQLFTYLYKCVYAIAKHNRYFKQGYMYQDYADYVASETYMRYKNKKQWQYDENGNPKMEKIRSILNYLHTIMYPRMIDWFSQEVEPVEKTPLEDSEVYFNQDYTLVEKLKTTVDELNVIDFDTSLYGSINTAREYLKRIPYYSDRIVWENIYISCMLSFLNSITLPTKFVQSRVDMERCPSYIDRSIDLQFEEQRKGFVILYHLDSSFEPYIQVLVTQVKHAIAKDLKKENESYFANSSQTTLIQAMDFFRDNFEGGED